MRKLISKNPVQRYKQGKQIIKAAGGTVVGTARRNDYKKGEVIYATSKDGKPIVRYTSGPDQKWYYVAEGSTGYDRYGNKNTFLGGQWLSDIIGHNTWGRQVRVNRNTGDLYVAVPNNNRKFKNVGKKLNYRYDWGDKQGQFNGEDYIYPNLKKPSTVTKKSPIKTSTSTDGSNTSFGKSNATAGKSNVVVGNTKVVTPVDDNHYIATRGDVNKYRNIISQLGLADRDAVRKFQTEKLGLTGSAADGIWGKNTQAAYDNYINNKANTTNAAQIMPAVTNFANSINIPDTIKIGSGNAANTKAFTDRLYNSIKITPTFKNGGLISNNPIERFKQGGVQKFQKAGNLPTAPKAEDRYSGGQRQSIITKGGRYGGTDKVEIKQVVGKKPGIFGSAPIIRQMVLHSTVSPDYNDTTYLEIPERKNPLVERKLRGIEKHPSVFKTYYSNVYPFFGDILPNLGSGTKEEYKTLKRRFNTAWNSAK